MGGSGKKQIRLSPVSMHVLTDLFLPLLLIKLLAPGAWLDAYTALGLLYGTVMVLVVIAFRGYAQYLVESYLAATQVKKNGAGCNPRPRCS